MSSCSTISPVMKVNLIYVFFWVCLFATVLGLCLKRRIFPSLERTRWGTLVKLPHVLILTTTSLLACVLIWVGTRIFEYSRLAPPLEMQVRGVSAMALYLAFGYILMSRYVRLRPIDIFLFKFRRENTRVVSLHFDLQRGKARRTFKKRLKREKYRRLLAAIDRAAQEARYIPAPVSSLDFTSAWFAGGRHKRTLDELQAILERTFPGAQVIPHARRNIVHVLSLNLRYCYTKRFSKHAFRKLMRPDSYWERGFVVCLPAGMKERQTSTDGQATEEPTGAVL